jgi:hypothetical protein
LRDDSSGFREEVAESNRAESAFGTRFIPRLKHVGFLARFRSKIYLSGWQFDSPVKKVGKDEYNVALSDHSDFEQLIEYVKGSDPSYVITDDFRVGDAKRLAREISKRLGVPARAMP